MAKKGQSIIEYTLAFVIVAILMRVMVGLWSWSIGRLSAREGRFEGTRVQAGSVASPGEPEVPLGG